MAYEIHLERPNDEKNISGNTITLAEWKAAVGEMANVRLRSGELPVTNPSTGEIILIPSKEGDAQVFFSEEAEWINIYRWRKGQISFKGSPNFNNQDDILRQTTRQLANLLNAKIIGDEGEIYD